MCSSILKAEGDFSILKVDRQKEIWDSHVESSSDDFVERLDLNLLESLYLDFVENVWDL